MRLIAAVDKNYLLGNNNTLPWRYKEDLKRFKLLTINHTLIMGAKTVLSLPKKLDNRIVIAVSSSVGCFDKADFTTTNLLKAVELAKTLQEEYKIVIAGGASIYEQAFENNLVSHIDLTFVPEFKGELINPVYFPKYYMSLFKESMSFVNSNDNRLTHKIFVRGFNYQ